MSTATVKHLPLGRTDLPISRIALGCMGFADPAHGVNPWASEASGFPAEKPSRVGSRRAAVLIRV
ncbi:hypothetical protein [Streptomyces sp. SD15]